MSAETWRMLGVRIFCVFGLLITVPLFVESVHSFSVTLNAIRLLVYALSGTAAFLLLWCRKPRLTLFYPPIILLNAVVYCLVLHHQQILFGWGTTPYVFFSQASSVVAALAVGFAIWKRAPKWVYAIALVLELLSLSPAFLIGPVWLSLMLEPFAFFIAAHLLVKQEAR